MLQARYDYYRGYRPDPRQLAQLGRMLETADARSNWRQLEGMFYQLMRAPLLRDLWQRLDVVKQFRRHVDNAPRKRPGCYSASSTTSPIIALPTMLPLIHTICQQLRGQPLGAVIIRSLAVNAAMLQDKELYNTVLQTFVRDNPDIGAIDRRFLNAIQQRL